ncbi:MAG: hypothetical protein ACREU3_02865 [Steroidobacteraceae bacterium]
MELRFVLRGRTRFFFGAASRFFGHAPLGLKFCSTSFLFGASLRFFGVTPLRFPPRRCAGIFLSPALRFLYRCGAGPVVGATEPRAHHDHHDRSCERETDSADEKRHLHHRGSSLRFAHLRPRTSPRDLGACL